jgi:hypothetical protein
MQYKCMTFMFSLAHTHTHTHRVILSCFVTDTGVYIALFNYNLTTQERLCDGNYKETTSFTILLLCGRPLSSGHVAKFVEECVQEPFRSAC